MPFTAPETVTSPKGSVSALRILLNTGEGGWSLADMDWKEDRSLGIRWNGDAANPLGNPQSRGIATWFILPEPIAAVLRERFGESLVGLVEADAEITRVKLRPLPRRIWRRQEQERIDDEWLLSVVDRGRGIQEISNSRTGHFLQLHRTHVKSLIRDPVSNTPGGPQHGILDLTVQIVFEDSHLRLEPLRTFTEKSAEMFAELWNVGPEQAPHHMLALIEQCRKEIIGRKGQPGPWEAELLDFAESAVQNRTLLRLALVSIEQALIVSELPPDDYDHGYNYSRPHSSD